MGDGLVGSHAKLNQSVQGSRQAGRTRLRDQLVADAQHWCALGRPAAAYRRHNRDTARSALRAREAFAENPCSAALLVENVKSACLVPGIAGWSSEHMPLRQEAQVSQGDLMAYSRSDVLR